jgi:hypothetical protein
MYITVSRLLIGVTMSANSESWQDPLEEKEENEFLALLRYIDMMLR